MKEGVREPLDRKERYERESQREPLDRGPLLCARGEITSRYRHIQPLERAAGKKRHWMKSRYMHKEPLERERGPFERARARG